MSILYITEGERKYMNEQAGIQWQYGSLKRRMCTLSDYD